MSFLDFFKWSKKEVLPTTDLYKYYELELNKWLTSFDRLNMLIADKYYVGKQDILKRKRTAIGERGELTELRNLPNNTIVNNLYGKIVNQKANYILSKPLTFESGDQSYDLELKKVLNDDFMRRLKNTSVDALNGGISWIMPYYNDKGEFCFQSFRSYEILPFWKDAEHTELESAIRCYNAKVWKGGTQQIVKKVEIFTQKGIERFVLEGTKLVVDDKEHFGYYARIKDKVYSWDRIPLIPFKSNGREIPLINKCKGLQDALNIMMSDFANVMQEDCRNTILVIKNYDGQNLGEFRRNLSTYGAVKVKTVDGSDGGVETLNITVNKDNYESIIKELKKAIIENCASYDAKDDRLGGNANQINIKSMYSDIDIDADNMETEFKASLNQLLFFVKSYISNKTDTPFNENAIRITFNRDTILNETEVIDNLVKLGVKLPNELLIGQIPFVNDVKEVTEMLKKEELNSYMGAFND